MTDPQAQPHAALPAVLTAAALAPGRAALRDDPPEVLLALAIELLLPLGSAARAIDIAAHLLPERGRARHDALQLEVADAAAQIGQLLWFALLAADDDEAADAAAMDLRLGLVEDIARRAMSGGPALICPVQQADLAAVIAGCIADGVASRGRHPERWDAAMIGGVGRAAALHLLACEALGPAAG